MSIKEWFEQGVADGKKYMMTCGTGPWHPVYVDTYDEFRSKMDEGEKVKEVYDLGRPLEEQMDGKAWNPPDFGPGAKRRKIETIVVGDEVTLFVGTDWSPNPVHTTMWMFSLPPEEESALLGRPRERGSILVRADDKLLDVPSLSPNVESDGTVPVVRGPDGAVDFTKYSTVETVVLFRG